MRFVDAFRFATPRTPPFWQRSLFLINCLVLRRLLASERSGVVKTFRYATLRFQSLTIQASMTVVIALNYAAYGVNSEIRVLADTRVSTGSGRVFQNGLSKLSVWGQPDSPAGIVGFAGNIQLIHELLQSVRVNLNETQDSDWVDRFCDEAVRLRTTAEVASKVSSSARAGFLLVNFKSAPQFTKLIIEPDGQFTKDGNNLFAVLGSGSAHEEIIRKTSFDGLFSDASKRDLIHSIIVKQFDDAGIISVGGPFVEWKAEEGKRGLTDTVYPAFPLNKGSNRIDVSRNSSEYFEVSESNTGATQKIYSIRSFSSAAFSSDLNAEASGQP